MATGRRGEGGVKVPRPLNSLALALFIPTLFLNAKFQLKFKNSEITHLEYLAANLDFYYIRLY